MSGEGMIDHYFHKNESQREYCSNVADDYKFGNTTGQWYQGPLYVLVMNLMLAGFCLLLTIAHSPAQSITVSGGRGSMIVSGRGTVQKTPEKPQDVVPPVPVKTPAVQIPVKPEPAPAPQKRREWYLVSESWCSHCPAARRRFLAKGWPASNILTIAQCRQKFGFCVPHVPFEFGEPETTPKGVSVTIQNPASEYRTPPRQRLPVVNTPWGRQDLETYEQSHRGCNCSMCRGVRAIIQQYRYRTMSMELPQADFGQDPTPDATLTEMLLLMNLRASDVLCDLGCGDGRILTEAVQRYGCRGVGVEIDKKKVEEARRRIADLGLSQQIQIIHGDVLDFDPEAYGITAVTAYLYEDLLSKITPQLATARVVASPFHQIPGLSMTKNGDVWIYRRPDLN